MQAGGERREGQRAAQRKAEVDRVAEAIGDFDRLPDAVGGNVFSRLDAVGLQQAAGEPRRQGPGPAGQGLGDHHVGAGIVRRIALGLRGRHLQQQFAVAPVIEDGEIAGDHALRGIVAQHPVLGGDPPRLVHRFTAHPAGEDVAAGRRGHAADLLRHVGPGGERRRRADGHDRIGGRIVEHCGQGCCPGCGLDVRRQCQRVADQRRLGLQDTPQLLHRVPPEHGEASTAAQHLGCGDTP